MTAKLTILGCGNSTGVPASGGFWGDCDPKEPKNRRMRSSILLQTEQTNLVVDTGPDFREQMNAVSVMRLDGVLYSHAHGDHVHGIDELRINTFRRKELTQVYGNREALDDLTRRFDYLFQGGKHELYPPVLNSVELNKFGQRHQIGDIGFIPFEQDHGSCTSVGFRFGDTAYSVDMVDLNDFSIDLLKGIKTWIVDCAAYHYDESLVHASINKIYELNLKINADKVILTSLSLGMDYNSLCDELQSGYIPAYDMMTLNIKL